jgi:hypothetical protein
VSELDSRPAPGGLVIARFGAAESARSWLAATGHKTDGTAVLVAGATEPVWWPPERQTQRPEWSRRADFPPDRLGQFVCVWADPIIDRSKGPSHDPITGPDPDSRRRTLSARAVAA